MKHITAPRAVRKATNCTGPEQVFWDQTLEVEADDVGKARRHYLGHNRRTYIFVQSDVGRRITNTQQGSSYSCWSFNP